MQRNQRLTPRCPHRNTRAKLTFSFLTVLTPPKGGDPPSRSHPRPQAASPSPPGATPLVLRTHPNASAPTAQKGPSARLKARHLPGRGAPPPRPRTATQVDQRPGHQTVRLRRKGACGPVDGPALAGPGQSNRRASSRHRSRSTAALQLEVEGRSRLDCLSSFVDPKGLDTGPCRA